MKVTLLMVSTHLMKEEINGSRLSIMGQELRIRRTYAKEFERRLDLPIIHNVTIFIDILTLPTNAFYEAFFYAFFETNTRK